MLGTSIQTQLDNSDPTFKKRFVDSLVLNIGNDVFKNIEWKSNRLAVINLKFLRLITFDYRRKLTAVNKIKIEFDEAKNVIKLSVTQFNHLVIFVAWLLMPIISIGTFPVPLLVLVYFVIFILTAFIIYVANRRSKSALQELIRRTKNEMNK